MTRRTATGPAIHALFLATALLITVSTVEATDKDAQWNVLVTIRVGSDGATQPREYVLVAVADGRKTTFRSGQKVPIPVTTFRTSDAGVGVPITSYTYQDIGFETTVEATLRHDSKIYIKARVEDSWIHEGQVERDRPIVDGWRHDLGVVLDDRIPVRIAHVAGDSGGPEFLEIQAELLR